MNIFKTTAFAVALLLVSSASIASKDKDPRCDFPYAGLYNISTRALVQGGNEIAIGGFIIKEDEDLCVVIRGRGPSLQLENAQLLSDPQVTLYRRSDQSIVDSNDNWEDHPDSELLEASGLASVLQPDEAGIFICLPSGGYTAHLESADNQYGIGIVEIIDVFFDHKAEDFGWGEDDNRGHGNDCDRDDDDNPGRP